MTDTTLENAETAPLVPMRTRLGPVHIAVTDREAALAVWRDVVGLQVIAEPPGRLTLGAAGVPLIELHLDAERPAMKGTAGLYHVAIHVPTRPDLAAFLARAITRRAQVSPTDHLVSEAIYLWDRDGNGIEITFETPWRGRLGLNAEGGYAVTADGRPHSGREPIDVDDLMGELAAAADRERLPAGTRIGHIHVHVGDLAAAMTFYRDVLGFGGQLLSEQFGMGDVTLDYMPHIIAFNIWQGRNVAQPPAGTAGLRKFVIEVPGDDAVAGMRRRLEQAG
ncbi:MAG TPA: VOC family protein, partial [Devosiaceae bacterium]|nr:VOC family protein [Devosiaceae bacterium]